MFSSVKVLVCFHVHKISRHSQSCFVVRNYGKWFHRRPVRVIEPEDYENGKQESKQVPLKKQGNVRCVPSATSNEVYQCDEIRKRITAYEKQLESAYRHNPKLRNNQRHSEESVESTAKEFASDNEIPAFNKLSEKDSMFSTLMNSVKSKKQREKKGYILLEGKRLIADTIAAGIIPQYVFFSKVSCIRGLELHAKETQLYKIPYKTLSLWSDVSTSQGIVAFCKIPVSENIVPSDEALPVTIVCDNVREPGNLGAILRTAVAAGCQQVVLTKGCTDLWDPKVLRSGVGAHFRMKILRDVTWEDLSNIITNSFVCLADNNLNHMDSSNVHDNEYSNYELVMTEPTEVSGNEETASVSVSDRLPIVPYYNIDYASQTSVVLVIGGETQGLSPHSYQLASSNKGVRVHIPLSNGMESLNTGTALGVIAFEIKKQFLAKSNNEHYQEQQFG